MPDPNAAELYLRTKLCHWNFNTCSLNKWKYQIYWRYIYTVWIFVWKHQQRLGALCTGGQWSVFTVRGGQESTVQEIENRKVNILRSQFSSIINRWSCWDSNLVLSQWNSNDVDTVPSSQALHLQNNIGLIIILSQRTAFTNFVTSWK